MKRLAILLILAVVLFINPMAVLAEELNIAAQGAVLYEPVSGRILWGKNETQKLAMASTTKIMTAIIALENAELSEIVTASGRAASAPETKMHLRKGEEQRLEDLLYALLLESANDSAVAIAEHIGGSVENFCDMMTNKAHELGSSDTQFKTPNGLDAEGHYSTALDLAKITAYALQNEKFVEIINTKSVTTPVSGGDFKSYYIANTNRFLNEYSGALGVKTGFTGQAGQCFVGAAERDGMLLISVVLASGWGSVGKEQKWRDTKTLMNYGFDNFKECKLVEAGTAL
ncbi:MAG: D-alanyl-D-alanine carboxypeptidase, partial [Firmicutes bacterium]|nr:D-alanyl-D-alanine carboxypeptidase [Bacillota bacterium]